MDFLLDPEGLPKGCSAKDAVQWVIFKSYLYIIMQSINNKTDKHI